MANAKPKLDSLGDIATFFSSYVQLLVASVCRVWALFRTWSGHSNECQAMEKLQCERNYELLWTSTREKAHLLGEYDFIKSENGPQKENNEMWRMCTDVLKSHLWPLEEDRLHLSKLF